MKEYFALNLSLPFVLVDHVRRVKDNQCCSAPRSLRRRVKWFSQKRFCLSLCSELQLLAYFNPGKQKALTSLELTHYHLSYVATYGHFFRDPSSPSPWPSHQLLPRGAAHTRPVAHPLPHFYKCKIHFFIIAIPPQHTTSRSSSTLSLLPPLQSTSCPSSSGSRY